MTFSLKRLSQEEMDQATVVHRTSFDERLPWIAGLHAPDEDRAFFRHRVFSACQVWGAIDEEMIGFIAFRDDWIDHLYILPHRQRLGVGRALLKIAQAASPVLMLWTFQRNPSARRFYETHGFVAIRETDGSRNAEREPDVLYRWRGAEAGSPEV